MLKVSILSLVLYVTVPGFLIFIFACSTGSTPPSSPTPTPLTQETSARPRWESEWEKVLQGAKKENKLVIYNTAPGEVRQALQSSFKDKYGIFPEIVTLRSGEMAAKFISERRSGIFTVDVYIGGNTTALAQLKPQGILDPLEPALILPEVIDPKLWYENKLWWLDAARTTLMFLGYPVPNLARNTNLVRAEEIKSYRDLLDPRWKGKIIMNNPTIGGTGSKGFSVIAFHLLNLDFWKEFARQEPLILNDQRQQVEWVVQGKYLVVFFPQSGVITEFKKAGAPILEFIPEEGTYLTAGSGNLAVINRAPHPSTARLFINWLLSREGQKVFSQAFGRQSLRLDVTTEGLDPVALRQPGGKYFLGSNNEEFTLKELENQVISKEIFAPFLR